MRIVMPMAGRGSRFDGAGYALPKPLIPVAGRPMFAWALQSASAMSASTILVVALREHEERFGLRRILAEHIPRSHELVLLDNVTQGQLCTVLAARDWLASHEDLLIMSSDTYVSSHLSEAIAQRESRCKGIISTFDLPGDRWSFARTDESGRVVEVSEKVRISNQASTGLYYFSDGLEFLDVSDRLIGNREMTRGEYYVMPVYGKYLDRGWLVTISQAEAMWDMGTPDAKARFEQHVSAQHDIRQ